jgi:hypothetical protein
VSESFSRQNETGCGIPVPFGYSRYPDENKNLPWIYQKKKGLARTGGKNVTKNGGRLINERGLISIKDI